MVGKQEVIRASNWQATLSIGDKSPLHSLAGLRALLTPGYRLRVIWNVVPPIRRSRFGVNPGLGLPFEDLHSSRMR